MEFAIYKVSGRFGLAPHGDAETFEKCKPVPAAYAKSIVVPEWDDPPDYYPKFWFVEISDLNALLELAGSSGQLIIDLKGTAPWDDNIVLPVIKIYDDFVE